MGLLEGCEQFLFDRAEGLERVDVENDGCAVVLEAEDPCSGVGFGERHVGGELAVTTVVLLRDNGAWLHHLRATRGGVFDDMR